MIRPAGVEGCGGICSQPLAHSFSKGDTTPSLVVEAALFKHLNSGGPLYPPKAATDLTEHPGTKASISLNHLQLYFIAEISHFLTINIKKIIS